MVFFVCGSCGTSLKKNQVEKHSHRCRGCQYMTCMDCSKDFWGNDYASHTTCLTENQKYGGTNYVPKELKGQKKQEAWIMQVQTSISAAHNMSPQLKKLFENILQFDNIPRKRAKFLNFLRNNNYKNEYLIEEAWKFFEEVSNKYKSQTSTGGKPEQCESSSTEISQAENQEEPKRKSKKERKEERKKKQTKIQKKDKKRKAIDDDEDETQEAEKPKKKKKKWREEEETNQENEDPVEDVTGSADQEATEEVDVNRKSSPFKWKKAISTVLQDAPEEGMKMKKLKRKILALYIESQGEEASKRKSVLEIDALIQKKLKMRNDKFVVLKDRVKLRQ